MWDFEVDFLDTLLFGPPILKVRLGFTSLVNGPLYALIEAPFGEPTWLLAPLYRLMLSVAFLSIIDLTSGICLPLETLRAGAWEEGCSDVISSMMLLLL